MSGQLSARDPFQMLNFDCISIVFTYLTPIDVVRCSLTSRTLREWSLSFMSGEGLRCHFPYSTDTGSFKNDTFVPAKRYSRFAQLHQSVKEGSPSTVLKFGDSRPLKAVGAFVVWISNLSSFSGPYIRYHLLRNKFGEKHRSRIQPVRKLKIPNLAPSHSFRAEVIDLSADGYLFIRGTVKRNYPSYLEFTRDLVFALEGPKLLWYQDRRDDELPKLYPLYIGKEQIYFVTKVDTPELIAYSIKTGQRLYCSMLPGQFRNNTNPSLFSFVRDKENEFLAHVSRVRSPFVCVTLVSGIDGKVSQEIRIKDDLWPLKFQGQPNVAAFALERNLSNFLGKGLDLKLFEKYSLQRNGMFTIVSRDLFIVEGSAAGTQYIYVDPFRHLAFAMTDATFETTIPRILEPKEMSDKNLRNEIGAVIKQHGVNGKIDSWLTLTAANRITLPPKTVGSKPREPWLVCNTTPNDTFKLGFWEERGFMFSINSSSDNYSEMTYIVDFTTKPNHSNPGIYAA
ncbi:hypothetical protein PAAG_05023 [Paracoccidioides lutzii Pb01]|uniref:F-box domain-containing protein n=1 Tax=Paracoccidioides lutzii (strain ATCC MYA-826 / Pb01) TaxID=502779 RepID=C1H2N0_PARBA|nr:hypothetical protein PAAG_05023 [Paracoccidioides lutzii Pb01]EEH33974.1 hypothetical protein PAAG_05023 [Paracoccidioides lutzii Pb01]